jgi:hypothetical protein
MKYLHQARFIYNFFWQFHLMKKDRGIKRLAAAASQCSSAGLIYGNCINLNFENVQKGTCAKEFLLFKECVIAAVIIIINNQ